MNKKIFGTLVAAVMLALPGAALADNTNTEVIGSITSSSISGRVHVKASDGALTCSFSDGANPWTTTEAVIVDGLGVGATADTRREAVSLLMSAHLAGKSVKLVVRRSDTGGQHCRIYSVEVL